MHNQVRQWAQQGYLRELIALLHAHQFQVVLTSDHGNIEAQGCGRPSEGVIADLRGERVRLYPDALLRAKMKAHFPDAIEWPAIGLPEEVFPLLAPHREAFIAEGEHCVTHGGVRSRN